jgi:hypothetical protein
MRFARMAEQDGDRATWRRLLLLGSGVFGLAFAFNLLWDDRHWTWSLAVSLGIAVSLVIFVAARERATARRRRKHERS